ncbi:ABC transporter ATP-binding protein [Pseudonocardia ailaonensis]|uniref:ABC transporter ATP-binding protein n=1 Tax=Pseudonocardia ailaonensis TaxID=367279 RepID=A0ABN2NHG6_9PSEU
MTDTAIRETAATTAVRIEGLGKTYGRRRRQVTALHGIDLEIRRGELLVLLGPSGCGKSTMLRCLAGLEHPSGGRIELAGTPVWDAATGLHLGPDARDIGLVFQTYVLWPHMTVRQNVEYPLRARRRTDLLRDGAVDRVLDLVDCTHLADRYPGQLSGGQQQRIALARALVADPALLLLDEPLSNLDALLRTSLRAQLREVHRRVGYTGVYVTHDQVEALGLGDRIAVMEAGRIAQIATPRELFERPASEYVADFLGVRNTVHVRATGRTAELTGDGVHARLGAPVDAGEYTLFFRPESVALHRDEPARPATGAVVTGGRVTEVMYGGTDVDVVVAVGDRRLHARLRTSADLPGEGDRVTVVVPADGLLLYDRDHRLVR